MMFWVNLLVAVALFLLPQTASQALVDYLPRAQDLPDGMIMTKEVIRADMVFKSWSAGIPGTVLKVSALAILAPTEREAESNLRALIVSAQGWDLDAKCGWPLGPTVVCFKYAEGPYEGFGVAVVERKMLWAITVITVANSGGERWLENLSRTIYNRTHPCPPRLCTNV